MKTTPIFILLVLLLSFKAHSQTDQSTREGNNNTRIAIASDEGSRDFQARWGYAPAVRTGDYIHMSGLIAGPAGSEGTDAEAFKNSLRRTFKSLQGILRSLDASLEDVIKINTYHVFTSPHFDGDKLAHMEAVRDVKTEFMGNATPTWTAIGVSELFTDNGLVEIELTVYAPVEN